MPVYVNKVEITEAQIGREMQYHPAPTRERAWQLAARSLVIRQLLLQRAAEDGLCHNADPGSQVTPEEEQAIDRLLEENVAVPEADTETCRRFYDSHPESFRTDDSAEFCRDCSEALGWILATSMTDAEIGDWWREQLRGNGKG